MLFELDILCPEDLESYKRDMQEAFQKGAEAELTELDTETEAEILPEEDINRSLTAEGAAAYKAMLNGEIVGGAIVVIDESARKGHLDFLYVKHSTQSKGIGKMIWQAIEEKYPDIQVWETVTPHFEKRNIHFYINKCGFSAVEFFNPYHSSCDTSENTEREECFFRLKKVMG